MGDRFFDDVEFCGTSFDAGVLPDNLFSILEALEGNPENEHAPLHDTLLSYNTTRLISQKSTSSTATQDYSEDIEVEPSPSCKRQKLSSEDVVGEGKQKMVHIRVERNRRKQMNEHLAVLRTLMPCFYVKRGDQASIIGGVVDYIKELQQVLQSLEAKKQRKVYSEVLSPRLVSSSPRPSPLSPRRPPLSPRVNLPISPRTPQPTSPYKARVQSGFLSPTISTSHETSICSSLDNVKDLAANSKSLIADVEVKCSGSNVLLRTASPRIPGQALKIIAALEGHSLEFLHVSINTTDDTMLNSFTIKIGIECKLSAEELANAIQQTFC